jgi:hypothetical protein
MTETTDAGLVERLIAKANELDAAVAGCYLDLSDADAMNALTGKPSAFAMDGCDGCDRDRAHAAQYREAADVLASLSRAHEELKAELEAVTNQCASAELELNDTMHAAAAYRGEMKVLQAQVESLKAENATLRKGRG